MVQTGEVEGIEPFSRVLAAWREEQKRGEGSEIPRENLRPSNAEASPMGRRSASQSPKDGSRRRRRRRTTDERGGGGGGGEGGGRGGGRGGRGGREGGGAGSSSSWFDSDESGLEMENDDGSPSPSASGATALSYSSAVVGGEEGPSVGELGADRVLIGEEEDAGRMEAGFRAAQRDRLRGMTRGGLSTSMPVLTTGGGDGGWRSGEDGEDASDDGEDDGDGDVFFDAPESLKEGEKESGVDGRPLVVRVALKDEDGGDYGDDMRRTMSESRVGGGFGRRKKKNGGRMRSRSGRRRRRKKKRSSRSRSGFLGRASYDDDDDDDDESGTTMTAATTTGATRTAETDSPDKRRGWRSAGTLYNEESESVEVSSQRSSQESESEVEAAAAGAAGAAAALEGAAGGGSVGGVEAVEPRPWLMVDYKPVGNDPENLPQAKIERWIAEDADRGRALEELRGWAEQTLPREFIGAFCDDLAYRRYLNATHLDMDKAREMLEETSEWFLESSPRDMECEVCVAVPGSHTMFVLGYDKRKRPVVYQGFKGNLDRDPDALIKHSIVVMEAMISLMAEGVEQWVWIIDFTGFGYSWVNKSLMKKYANLFNNFYAERLAEVLLLEPPFLFSALWRFGKRFAEPETVEKVSFLSQPEMEGKFGELFDVELVDVINTKLSFFRTLSS